MAHKAGQGATRNGRDSGPQFRGLKRYGGEKVKPGEIIVRQCGTKFKPGKGVGMGRDYTIFATIAGHVKFESRRRISVYAEN